jgi:hypothetical protein
MITDCVFWLIIFPFRAMKDYDFDLVSTISLVFSSILSKIVCQIPFYHCIFFNHPPSCCCSFWSECIL